MTTPERHTLLDAVDAASEVDSVLRRSRLPVTSEERERFVRIYPTLVEGVKQLRLPEARHGEPSLIFLASLDR